MNTHGWSHENEKSTINQALKVKCILIEAVKNVNRPPRFFARFFILIKIIGINCINYYI